MRNVKIDEVDRLDRDVVALGNDYAQGFILPPHQHRRAQLLYGATGLMYVTTQDGEWVVPPQHAVWIPPETVHAVRFAGVTTRSLYIEPDCVAAFIKHRRCEVISVSPLLRQLLLEAVDLPPLYDSPRDRTLIQLMLLELAAMPVREFDIPLPQHPALLALCQAFLLNPSIHDPAARWARALFMSPSTFRRHFLNQLHDDIHSRYHLYDSKSPSQIAPLITFAGISRFNRGIIAFSFPGSEGIESPQDVKNDDDDFFNDKMVHKERLRSSHGYRQNR